MSKKFSTEPIRGMKDFYPTDLRVYNYIFSLIDEVADLYCYEEYEGPVLEPIEIYAAKSSEELVNEQSFIVEKKEGERLILRPEVTPTLARMVARRNKELKKPIRWYTKPICFRYERPQKGRRRSFYQINYDILGDDSLYAELEIFNITVDILTGLGATSEQFQIYYNNRKFIDALCRHIIKVPENKIPLVYKVIDKAEKMDENEFEKYVIDTFQEESIVQGILKLKDAESMEELLSQFEDVPKEFFDSEGYKELIELDNLLKKAGISEYCSFSPSIVRGLDYYTATVFEVLDTGKENRRSIFGGGRYDDLTSLFSDEQISGIGFGMGVLMLSLFLKTYDLIPEDIKEKDYTDAIYIASINDKVDGYALEIASLLREEDFPCMIDYRFKGLKNQLSKANELGVLVSIILGPNEMEQRKVTIKNMTTEEQKTVKFEDLIEEIYDVFDEIEDSDDLEED